jgi:hypothetical protein
MVTVTTPPGPGGAGRVFLAPKGYTTGGPGQQGLMIVDEDGKLVWFQPSRDIPMDLKVQAYQGWPHLTWWAGSVTNGVGTGAYVIADTSYRTVATVRAGNGLQADLHEFVLTPRSTALISAYAPTRADLSALGGKSDVQVYDGVVQEIDVASGGALFEWRSLRHVGLDESYVAPTGDAPFDYFHLNSIAVAPDGDLVISARNTCAIYKISRRTGEVVWRLGGKRSDFEMGDGAHFYWQHDARPHGSDRISLFDNGASPAREPQSRGLVLALDRSARKATVARQLTHPAGLLAPNQGSLQLLPDGQAFVGWGAQPYFSRFDQSGELVFDGRFPADDQSYRAFQHEWDGQPADAPAVAVGPNAVGGVTAYVSWNGATRVARWRVLSGDDPAQFAAVATVPRTGFETAISVNSTGLYLVVAAMDRSGAELGRSQPVRI